MADVSAALNNWSTTASSNSPNDNTTIGSGLADNLQAIQAVVRGDLAAVGTAVASSAAPDVGALTGLLHSVTGNATITGLGSSATTGIWKILLFESTPLLVNSTALAMVGARDITATPGALGVFFCTGSNIWRNVSFFHATAGAVVGTATTTVAGVLEVATAAEALAATSDSVAITPTALDAVLGLVKLASSTVANTTVADITMTAYTAYTNKMIVFRNVVPATNAAILCLRTSTDGGSSYAATSYAYGMVGASSLGTSTIGSAADTKITLTTGNTNNVTANGGISGIIKLYGTTSTATKNNLNYESATFNSDLSGYWTSQGAGIRNNAEDIDGVRLIFDSGNVGSGTWDLYGFN